MNDRRLGIGLILLGALIISPVGAMVAGMAHVSSLEFVVLRCAGIAVFFFAAVAATTGIGGVARFRQSGLPGLVASVSLGTIMVMSVYAFHHAPVARVLLLFSTAPLQAALIARLVLGERLAPATVLALFLSLGGIVLIVAGGREEAVETGASLLGDIAALASSFLYAVFAVALRAGREVDMRISMLMAGLIGMTLALILFFATDQQVRSSGVETMIIFGVGFFLTGGAFFLFTIGSKSVSSAEFSMVSLSEIFFGSLWAWLFLSQHISFTTALGGALFFLAILLDARFASKHPANPRENGVLQQNK